MQYLYKTNKLSEQVIVFFLFVIYLSYGMLWVKGLMQHKSKGLSFGFFYFNMLEECAQNNRK